MAVAVVVAVVLVVVDAAAGGGGAVPDRVPPWVPTQHSKAD